MHCLNLIETLFKIKKKRTTKKYIPFHSIIIIDMNEAISASEARIRVHIAPVDFVVAQILHLHVRLSIVRQVCRHVVVPLQPF